MDPSSSGIRSIKGICKPRLGETCLKIEEPWARVEVPVVPHSASVLTHERNNVKNDSWGW